jgi:hypothetical protein
MATESTDQWLGYLSKMRSDQQKTIKKSRTALTEATSPEAVKKTTGDFDRLASMRMKRDEQMARLHGVNVNTTQNQTRLSQMKLGFGSQLNKFAGETQRVGMLQLEGTDIPALSSYASTAIGLQDTMINKFINAAPSSLETGLQMGFDVAKVAALYAGATGGGDKPAGMYKPASQFGQNISAGNIGNYANSSVQDFSSSYKWQ